MFCTFVYLLKVYLLKHKKIKLHVFNKVLKKVHNNIRRKTVEMNIIFSTKISFWYIDYQNYTMIRLYKISKTFVKMY